MHRFVHLRTYSDYSLGKSSIRVKELVKYSSKYGYPAIALTDQNNLFASLEFALEATKSAVQPIAGIDVTIKFAPSLFGNLLLLAATDAGYKNLLSIASDLYLKKSNDEPIHITLADLLAANDGLIALVANPIDSIERKLFNTKSDINKYIDTIHGAFGDRLYIELIRSTEDNCEDVEFENKIIDYAYAKNIALVATNHCAFGTPDSYEAQDALSCITSGRYILEEDRPRSKKSFYLKTQDEMVELFNDLPEAINNSVIIAKRCHVCAESHAPLLPNFSTDISEEELMKQESMKGLARHIEKTVPQEQHKEYYDRLEFELSIINRMKYAGYFLIVSDFIRWSKSQGIPVGPGRGSGAGSIVAWALEITDLDPIKYGLLFERFLNPDRVSMPDFDIDFCQDRREEVINYVKQRYGDERVSQIITYGKLQARAVLRDVGRVLQMPYGAIDRICKMVPNNPANPITLKEAIDLDKELQQSRDTNEEIAKLLSISLQLEGLNRHVSTHAAGVVIADRPIKELAPLYKDSIDSMPAVQYSMKYAEAAGLVKFDFLGLKTLTVISWAENLIRQKNPDFDIRAIDLLDSPTYGLLSKGLTTGVFQFESAGMKEAIKRLKPDNVGDLIALGSLYRPGPMDNIPSYINRKHGLEQPEYLHPDMESILKETYGIIVYQEQVMEIARVLAGYTLGGADLLRRAMGKKIKAEMEAQRDDFISGCLKNNIEKSKANEIFALIEKFASYGFNKSHAAAYAIISYQTAYLKANYPLEFLVASMNSEIHDTDKLNLFIEEAKKFNIKVLHPDVNASMPIFSIEDNSIRYALCAIKSVAMGAAEKIAEARKEHGKFEDIYDFASKCDKSAINRKSLERLIKSGALSELEPNRHKLWLNVDILLKYAIDASNDKNSSQVSLFAFEDDASSYKPQMVDVNEWSNEELLQNEFEALGFYLSSHPLTAYGTKLKKLGVLESDKVEAIAGPKGIKIILAGVVTSRKVKSSKRGKYAFIQISDLKGLIEVSVFNEDLLYRSDNILQPGKKIVIHTEVKTEETGLRIIAENIQALEDSLSHIRTSLYVTITDPKHIDSVSKLTSDAGKSVYLSLKLPSGEVVSFRSQGQIMIPQNNEEALRAIPGVVVNEH